MTDKHQRIRELAAGLGELVADKQVQYGDSVGSTGEILRQLYSDGIRPDQYDDLQLVVRMLDKLKRIASRGPDGHDRGGENPFQDLAGYGLLGLLLEERREHTGRDHVEVSRRVDSDVDHDIGLCYGCGRLRSDHVLEGDKLVCPDARSMIQRANPIPRFDGCVRLRRNCHGCKHLDETSNDTQFTCRKTNRPGLDAIVQPNNTPSWCPGREERVL